MFHSAWDSITGQDVAQTKKDVAAMTVIDKKLLPDVVIQGEGQEVFKRQADLKEGTTLQKERILQKENYLD